MAPVPQPLTLPATAEVWEGWLDARCSRELEQAGDAIDALKRERPSDPDGILRQWNDIGLHIANASTLLALMAQVHPEEKVRTRAESIQQDANRLATDLMLDRDVFDLLSAVDEQAVEADAGRVLRLALRDFRRAGVDRPDETRQRLRDIAEREIVLVQEFAKNVRDDVRRVTLRPEQLEGLPDDYVLARPPSDDGNVVVTTDYPDFIPFQSFARDRDARRQLMVEFLNRAWPANDDLLHELLELRRERAGLLDYDGWPDYDAEVKMIGDGEAIASFIDQITDAAAAPGQRDRDLLLARLQQDDPGATTIDRADSTYYAELIRRERYDVDAQLTRTYFDFTKVRAGLLDVTGRLFGLDYVPVEDATSWHGDVAVYDVQADGERLGRIYLDLHPREGKFKHAAQFTLVPGIGGTQLPEGTLVCNLPRGLMEHTDVVTLFHEFGHLVHHVLAGRHRWIRFSGVATEWDFVEAPSQMLEEWAWDADVLHTFATNSDGGPIPADLVERMRAAHEFGKGYQARTQMFYAAVSYRLHLHPPDDLTRAVRDLQAAYDLFPYIDGTHFQSSFGHLTGYTSAYYTYMWSLVIAKDLFSAFDGDDLFAPETARLYRDSVLVAGGSKDAADLVTDFLGRPYSFEAFRAWLADDTVPSGSDASDSDSDD